MEAERTKVALVATALLSGLLGYMMHDHAERVHTAGDPLVSDFGTEQTDELVIYDVENPEAYIHTTTAKDLHEAR